MQTTQITLYYRQGASDKVYQAGIEPVGSPGDKFMVTFAYGRRGATLQTGAKTTVPVDYPEAARIFQELVNQKKAKGYTPGEDGTPYQHSDKEVSGTHCQLLNPIEEDEALRLIGDSNWCLQEKKDGRRLLIRKEGAAIQGINRRGFLVGLLSPLIHRVQSFPGDCLVDGEAVGDDYFAFDLLIAAGAPLGEKPYRERLEALTHLVQPLSPIKPVETAFTTEAKSALWEQCRRAQLEGVVLKRLDAPYSPGRPASGGPQLKYKFYASGSFIVARTNGKRSVALRAGNMECGNVTIPPNEPIPQPGTVVEVRYLYAYRESGALFQPVYLGTREDILPDDCTAGQLKFKASKSEEE